jgi:hypothetical protein
MRATISLYFIFLVSHVYSQIGMKNYDGILWFGMNNPLEITDKTVTHPLFKSKEVTVSRDPDGTFIVKVTNQESIGHIIHVELRDSVDTNKLMTYSLLVKNMPYPVFSIGGKIVHDTISKTELLKSQKIDIGMDDPEFPQMNLFLLQSFDMEVDGQDFHSSSNVLTPSMIYLVTHTLGNKIRIYNDRVIMTASTTNRVARYIYNDKTFILVK